MRALLPVSGLVGIALSGSKAKKDTAGFAMVFVGAAALLSFAGCGGDCMARYSGGNLSATVTAASGNGAGQRPVNFECASRSRVNFLETLSDSICLVRL